MITFLDPSIGECRFLVGVTEYSKSLGCGLDNRWATGLLLIIWVVWVLMK
ncbi:hypothetical protein DCAR_0102330 [Daucus carota subsp. sativus]|uniref:Uncharacterized protein n=2 Tax=Daucus carota subsp. sativus TaxID=79200 RepID=A0A166H157_DAUCS|nr:hypothetical protein DCAR_0102330 [Daucus carota subsp. sativus]